MPILRNPILPGFNPDPSILRVGDDYYIATSTFEWYPGVQIHHSRDLANWDLVTRPLNRAVAARHARRSRLVRHLGAVPDPRRRKVLARLHRRQAQGRLVQGRAQLHRHRGQRSKGRGRDPVYVNSSGFDPSLFHDDDGRKWFVNMLWDHRVRPLLFEGIALQEFDPEAGQAHRRAQEHLQGTDLKLVEGPHLYKRNGWYYLLTAEGGTGYEHASTFARSTHDRRALRAPSRKVPRHRQGPSLQRGAALGPRRHRRDARRQDLLRPPDGPADRPVQALRARPRDRHPGSRVARRRLALAQERPRARRSKSTCPGTRDDTAYWSEQRYTFDGALHKDFQWLRTPEPDRIFQSGGGKLTSHRPRVDRLMVRAGAGRAARHALLVRRRDHARLLAHRRAPVRRASRTTTAATTSTISRSPRTPTASASS